MTRRLATVLTAGFALAACAGASEAPTVAPATNATNATTPSTSAVGADAAPDALQFSAPLIGGGDIELTTLAGRPVLLWFWAPW